jgi:hypothetical protein
MKNNAERVMWSAAAAAAAFPPRVRKEQISTMMTTIGWLLDGANKPLPRELTTGRFSRYRGDTGLLNLTAVIPIAAGCVTAEHASITAEKWVKFHGGDEKLFPLFAETLNLAACGVNRETIFEIAEDYGCPAKLAASQCLRKDKTVTPASYVSAIFHCFGELSAFRDIKHIIRPMLGVGAPEMLAYGYLATKVAPPVSWGDGGGVSPKDKSIIEAFLAGPIVY